MRELSKQDVLDLLCGATYLGTGGGGELDEGIALINEAEAAGKRFRLQSLAEAPDDALACTPYFLGAISALPPEEEALYERLPRPKGQAIQRAFERLEAYLDRKIHGAIACELGGSNTAVAFYIAAMNDGVVLDADPAGRAVPEITHSTYFLNDLPAAPVVVANAFGELMVLEGLADDMRAEHVVRAIAMASRNDVAAIDHALPVSELRGALIHGTMSLSLDIGRRCKAAIANGEDVADLLAQIGQGRVAFRGTVSETNWRTENGFTFGSFTLAGIDGFGSENQEGQNYKGQNYKVTLKNENMASWLDGHLDACIPELICAVDLDSGAPITNPNTVMGQNVAIIILPAPAPFLSPKGLSVFGPDYAGVTDDVGAKGL